MKVAIWGAGKMGWVHAEAYRKLSGNVEIAAVIEENREKGEKFSTYFGCMLLDKPKLLEQIPVDAIDICLPTYIHRQAILQAMEFSSYILCEKPICINRDEFEDLEKEIKARSCHLMIGQVLRFWNGYVKVKELVCSGVIGKPRFISCERRQKMPQWSNGNWLMDQEKSGGLLMDLCIHDVDYINWLMGLPERVFCENVNRDDGTGLHSLITMAYKDCCAHVIGAWGMPPAYHNGELFSYLEIIGDLGMVSYSGGDEVQLIVEEDKKILKLEPSDGYEEEIRYFVQCVSQKSSPTLLNITSVKGTMRILWAARQASDEKQTISL